MTETNSPSPGLSDEAMARLDADLAETDRPSRPGKHWSYAPVLREDLRALLAEVRSLRADLANERHDLEMVAHEVSLVYDHVTGGRASKPNTMAFEIISLADDYYSEIERENLAYEARASRPAQSVGEEDVERAARALAMRSLEYIGVTDGTYDPGAEEWMECDAEMKVLAEAVLAALRPASREGET